MTGRPHEQWTGRELAEPGQSAASRADSIVIRWVGEDSVPRRLRFEPRSVGGYQRISERWSGDEWTWQDDEIVAQVGLDAPSAIVVDSDPALGD